MAACLGARDDLRGEYAGTKEDPRRGDATERAALVERLCGNARANDVGRAEAGRQTAWERGWERGWERSFARFSLREGERAV